MERQMGQMMLYDPCSVFFFWLTGVVMRYVYYTQGMPGVTEKSVANARQSGILQVLRVTAKRRPSPWRESGAFPGSVPGACSVDG